MSWMTDNTKCRGIVKTTSRLARTQPEKRQKILYCWGCGEFGHSKNNFSYLRKKIIQPLEKPKQKIKTVKT